MKLKQHTKYTLSFGRDIEGTAEVSMQNFYRFCRVHVNNELDSYTIKRATGMWRGIPEKCFELVVIVPGAHYDANGWHTAQVLKKIALAYKEEFAQEAVMVQREDIRAAFI